MKSIEWVHKYLLMSKLKQTKKILYIFFLISIFFFFAFIDKKSNKLKCKDIKILFENNMHFIDEYELLKILNEKGFKLINNKLSEINILKIENELNKNPYIKEANVFYSLNGNLYIKIKQHQPLFRIFTMNYNSYFIDKDGEIFPLSKKFSPKILIINGHLNEPYLLRSKYNYKDSLPKSVAENTMLDELYKLALYIENDEFWKAQIEQVYVNKLFQIILIPRIGNHKIVLGNIKNLDKKMNKLLIFYKKAIKKSGWNKYKTIDLRFKNQIVCIKS